MMMPRPVTWCALIVAFVMLAAALLGGWLGGLTYAWIVEPAGIIMLQQK